jgi:salicylate hydroxylase
LLDVLIANIPKDRVQFGKRLEFYEQVLIDDNFSSTSERSREEVVLHFADGTSARADILVGSDGIKSTVRRQMFTSYASEIGASEEEYIERFVQPAWTGSMAYRALFPVEELRKVNPNHSMLKGPQQVRSHIPSTHLTNLLFMCSTLVWTKYALHYERSLTSC